jgi:hypothetical protein
MLPSCFPNTMPGKRVCKKPLRHRHFLERSSKFVAFTPKASEALRGRYHHDEPDLPIGA